jgi:hypothetical protein
LAVKIEVDTNPPAGAELTTTVVRRHAIMQLHHHDKACLLSGKLHAILISTCSNVTSVTVMPVTLSA